MLQKIPASTCFSNVDSQSGNLFLLLLNTLLASQCALKNKDLYPPDKGAKIHDGDHFDFIVVGTGSSGSVVGSRLTEEKKWKVLVVEAGDYPSEIPALFFNIQQSDQIWNYFSEPASESCLGYKNSVCHIPRGKILGGCSSINGMLYQRGSKEDHDLWYHEGNNGWDYDSLVQFYKMSENSLHHGEKYGETGLLPLTKFTFNETIREVLMQSARELGYDALEKRGSLGFLEGFQTIQDGVRINSAKAFLGALKDSNDLTLALNAHVEKVIIDKAEKKAKGVQVSVGGRLMNIYAEKEVILSAGAVNSPQILMLSGIGEQHHLKKIGVDVIQDLAVGQHLKDHIVMWLFTKLNDEALKPKVVLDEIYQYFVHKKGMFSNTGVLNILGYINASSNSSKPDIILINSIFPKNSPAALNSFIDGININQDSAEILGKYNVESHILVTFLVLLQPKSTGKILLRNKNASSYPEIRPGYFTDEKNEDLETIVKGIRLVEAQLKADAFKKLNPEILDIGLPNCRKLSFGSDAYWKCAVKNLGTTAYHMSSTCKMGPKSDKSAVVDSKLKVHGIKSLRVIDSSIMPNIVSGPPHAACTMIGQKGAQMIIDDYTHIHYEL